ncbi:sulfurtransferase [Nocardioidaceae bacterium]|nr:sulfurtransferase [Nocardioidaceae bacterium]
MGQHLISVDEFLSAILTGPPGEVTVLDVRYALGVEDGHAEYLAGHVPGAAYVDLETALAADPAPGGEGGRHPLPDPDRFLPAMRAAGVRSDVPVVVYDDWNNASAARCWWLLRHYGHDNVRVLDGGWQAWKDAGAAVEEGEPSIEEGDFEVGEPRLAVVGAEEAEAYAAEGKLVDVRPAERFRGEGTSPDPVAGHVPGAVNVPLGEHLDAGLVDLDVVEDYPEGDVAVMCGSGVTATLGILTLMESGRDAALYAGSFSDWIADTDREVTTGA